MTLLLLYVGLSVGFSFLCSILEASFLSARLVSLLERKEAGDRSAARLLHLRQESVDDALSAILILNTIANTAGAFLAGTRAEALFGHLLILDAPIKVPASWAFTALFIVLILVVSEIIPKTLGAVYSRRMVPVTARLVSSLIWFFTWVLPVLRLTRFVTTLLARKEKRPISRSELTALVSTAAREGTLPAADLQVLSNVLGYHEIKVEDVMTPRTVIAMLSTSASIRDFLENEDCRVFSRIPLFESDRDSVVGFVLQREVLSAAALGASRSGPLTPYLRKAFYLPEKQTVGRALRHMTERREHMALVTDEYGGISGLVSLEDLVETTLGIEILDESDRVADLRAEATKLRDRRLREFRRSREAVIETPPAESKP